MNAGHPQSRLAGQRPAAHPTATPGQLAASSLMLQQLARLHAGGNNRPAPSPRVITDHSWSPAWPKLQEGGRCLDPTCEDHGSFTSRRQWERRVIELQTSA